ncbi:MAG: excinuclease ABC subunit UvrA [Candidatus Dormibacteria bacterium]
MAQDVIRVRGAREHNLKGVDLDLPRDRLIVFTGISGSGKSSLAFDTIYAEGQRRYVESLSAYARQFLGQMEKPDVDQIDGLSPAISIDQKGTSKNPRSTVGTVTEIHDYLRLLFARVGHPHCPRCGREVVRQTVEQIADQVLLLPAGTRLLVMGPAVRGRKGEHRDVLEDARKAGFVRARIDGAVVELEDAPALDKKLRHDIDIVVDRVVVNPEGQSRVRESVETAARIGQGTVIIQPVGQEDSTYSENYACSNCGISMEELEPRSFSFNSPHGACPDCTGLGFLDEFDEELILPQPDLSIDEGAIFPYARSNAFYPDLIRAACAKHRIPTDVPIRRLTRAQREILLRGSDLRLEFSYINMSGSRRRYHGSFEGVIPNLARRLRETGSEMIRTEIQKYQSLVPCASCRGARLKPSSLAVTVGGQNLWQVSSMSVAGSLEYVRALALTGREAIIARGILKEIDERLQFLADVGLEYLTLERSATTLSGGETQRIRLATQIGSKLVGVLYVLDEPSIGLHQRDNRKLINTLTALRDLGNTLIVVEHDEETIRSADYVVDIGPGAGEHGGEVMFAGTLPALLESPTALTALYLRGERRIVFPHGRRAGTGKAIVIRGAQQNNLKDVDVSFPLGTFTAVTGVSGSGKSTLVSDILKRKLAHHFFRAREKPGRHRSISGLDHVDKVIDVDQSPIGRTPRSNPATYTGLFTHVRELFAQLPEARVRGYMPGRFSFNVRGGRCDACEGDGMVKIEMHFLPDLYVPCEQCKGARYNAEALEVKYRGHSIADVLAMTVEEAMQVFENIPRIRNRLQTLHDVGLGYIRLGQPATTLSGGEAQRVKLSEELSRRSTGRTLYILDEPTTGLHFADIERLLTVLHRLVDQGNTVIVIEHNLDVIKTADWIIDLGPEGGDGGGEVVATGTPEQVAANRRSHTGEYLAALLKRESAAAPRRNPRASAGRTTRRRREPVPA